MVQEKLRHFIFPLILFSLIIFSTFPTGITASSNEFLKTSNAPMSNVVIDGVINAAEWADADWEIDFYLDVDNTPDWNGNINVDGNNTLFIGEDSTNLYLGLDLCSDQSFNETGEWIGVWLNTANRVFNNYYEWADFFNNGTESLLRDVENDKPKKYYSNTVGFTTEYVNDDSEYISLYGTIDGNSDDLRMFWLGDFNITSETVGSDELYWINFSVDLTKWWPLEEEIDEIKAMEITIATEHNETIDDQRIILWNSDGSIPPFNDPQQVISLNNLNSYVLETFEYGLGNLTTDKKLQFSLIGNNSTPFKTRLDRLEFRPLRNYTSWAGMIQVPYSTIQTYQIAWGFGPSSNNATSHRMFEFAIPKIELELYDPNEDLGIMVGGYGTLSYVNGSNYWIFSITDQFQFVERSTYYMYYDMKGLTLPAVGAVSGYSVFLLIGVIGICSVIIAKKKLK